MQMYKFNPKCRGRGVVDVENVGERYVPVSSEEPRRVTCWFGFFFFCFFTCALHFLSVCFNVRDATHKVLPNENLWD